jgi:multisubunit Na+/H+ antiporter MnhB subunit
MSEAYREATRGTRVRLALLLLAVLLVNLLLPPWLRSYMADVGALPLCEQLVPLRAFIVGGYLVCVALAGLLAHAAVRTFRSGESPFPGAWVWRRTPIHRGWRATLDGLLLVLVAFAFLLAPGVALVESGVLALFDLPADSGC